MAYFLIFLAIAAVLGPLMAVVPSKRQRALASARDRAAAAGVVVTLREPTHIPPRLMRVSDNPLVCYALRVVPREAREWQRDTWVRTREGWLSASGAPSPKVLVDLPEGAEVVVAGWDDIRIYWDERGGVSATDNVINCLRLMHPNPELRGQGTASQVSL